MWHLTGGIDSIREESNSTASEDDPARTRSSVGEGREPAEAVVVVVPPGWRDTTAHVHRSPFRDRAVAGGSGGLASTPDDALHGGEVADAEHGGGEESRAHDGVGFRDRLENRRGPTLRAVLAGEEDGLDAPPLAGAHGVDHLDELVAPGVPRDDGALGPEHLGHLGRLLAHELLVVLQRPLHPEDHDDEKA